MLELLYLLTFLLLFFTIASCAYHEKRTKIVPAPTLPWVCKSMIAALKTHASPSKIAELGSGWGGLSFALARAFPDSQIDGYELSPVPYRFSKIRQALSRRNIRFHKNDFFEQDLSSYDAVICYLSPYHMERLKPKLGSELPSGTIVISNAFPIPGWDPVETRTTKFIIPIPVYVYKTP